MKTLLRYVDIWSSFLKISFMADVEYRTHSLIKVVGDIIWYMTQLSIFEVLFYHMPRIAGWDIHSTRVFMAVLFVIDALYMVIFSENFDSAAQMVRKGELDLVLVKPINSQFMFSCRKVNFSYLINFGLVCGYLWWGLHHLSVRPHASQILAGLLLMVCGLVILYSMRFFFVVLTIVFVNASNLNYVWYQFYRLGNRPHTFYPYWLRTIILTVVPVAMIVSIPATALTQSVNATFLIVSPLMALFLFYLSTRSWKFALRFYTSASS